VITRAVERGLDLLGRGLWHARLSRFLFWAGRRNPKVILYHACEPVESPFTQGLDVNTTPADFALQLDFLRQHYNVVSVDELAAGAPDKAAVITFDDGYRSVLEHAGPLLAERGLPATVYLITDAVGNGELVWVNEFNWLLVQHPALTVPIARHMLGAPPNTTSDDLVATLLDAFDPDLVDRLLGELWAAVPDERSDVLASLDLYLSWDEVRAMCGQGFSFGSHTASHPNLRRLPPDVVDREVDSSAAVVAHEIGACRSFAYPFGFTTPDVSRRVEGRPFSSVMVVGGLNYSGQPLRTARTLLTATTPAGMFAQLEVVGPAQSALRAALDWLKARARLPSKGHMTPDAIVGAT
jgi:peptidoglycan/xylan/chitin deacetylase (PgdA/CDA1 family)